MSSVIIKRWEKTFLGKNINFWVVVIDEEAYFPGGEIATSLEFTNPRKAIRDHVHDEDKTTMEELLGNNFREILKRNFPTRNESFRVSFFQNLKANQIFTTEYGVYSLSMRSNMPAAKSFQRWVYSILKEIRLTGSYTLASKLPFDNPLEIINQLSLQIPKYKERGDNSLRRDMCKALKEAYNMAKNPYQKKAGKKGGEETQRKIREIKDSLDKLKRKIEKSIEKIESDLEESLGQISSSESDSE